VATLPRLRGDLDMMPSPVEDRPGLLLRDSLHYSDRVLIIPPELVQGLTCFDGEKTERDLHELLYRMTGDLRAGEAGDQLTSALARSGFLQDENYAALREARHREFAEAPVRAPSHAGSAYPDDAQGLSEIMRHWMGTANGAQSAARSVMGIAAPHVSPEGGYESYRAAYSQLDPGLRDRTFVILGTSHYGAPDKFGLTRKPYVTPFGEARTDIGLVNELADAAGDAIGMEDYCHAVEHSIEFQVVFLQSVFGPDIRVLPVLCGSYFPSIYGGGMPEDDEGVKRFLGALGEVAAREEHRLCWVLGVDMAHMGVRYGDQFEAIADADEMLAVAERDRWRMERIAAGDAAGFWELVRENHDDLKWCGSAPFYTFLNVRPDARGTVDRYEQWNIDPQSVVSFAGMSFR
jgi:AmmeMemoRadiSam system protein B